MNSIKETLSKSFDELRTNGKWLISFVVSPSTMLRRALSNVLLSAVEGHKANQLVQCLLNRMLSALIIAGGLALTLGGCTYVQTVPGGAYAPYPPSAFEQTWAAALGAMSDEGVQIVSANRDSGTIRGIRGAINVTAIVQTRADGGVQVEFKTGGDIDSDPSLNQRVVNDYNRRMGR